MPAHAQISEEEIYAELDSLWLYARHGLSSSSGDIVVDLLDKITSNPEPYLDLFRRDLVVPSDAEALANSMTFRRVMMLNLLEKIETEESNEKFRELYRLSAARVDSLYALYLAAKEVGAPLEELEQIADAQGIAYMIQGKALVNLSERGDTVLLPELAARYDTTDTPNRIGIEYYFDTVGVSLEDYEPPSDDDSCTQIPAQADITFTTTSVWPTGYNAQITLTNTGTEAIRGWQLAFDQAPDITNLWNGQLTSEGSQRTVTDAGHNGVIAPGQSVTFGFQVQSGSVVEPSDYDFAFWVLGPPQ
jgi:cellulase/cellobiase CelA1